MRDADSVTIDDTTPVGAKAPNVVAMAARPYQRELVEECLRHLREPRSGGAPDLGRSDGTRALAAATRVNPNRRRSRSVLLQAPTGSGKTFVGLVCAALLQSELGVQVGWCAGRHELLRQAARENTKFGLGVDMALISMFDRSPPKVDLLIVDEAHHDGAMSMATLHGVIDPEFVIGLTATPFRGDRVKLCFEKTIRSCSIQRLVDDGYLSQYRHFTIPSWDPGEVADVFATQRERWGQSLVFFHTRAQAEKCHAAMQSRGVRSELVTGVSDRDSQIAAFERGDVEVLLSMNVLTEGFDCPSLKTVFCRPASRTPTVQMAGRVFRRHERTPVKQIVQARGVAMPFTRLVRPEEQHLLIDGAWRALGATRELDAEIEAQRRRLAEIKVELPRYLSRDLGRRRSGRRRREGGDGGGADVG